ncbi:MAG: alpha/beta hydrolase [Nannocystaceae bacterium]|nr:alpha/beta hydrolase [Myxococcales bacterium]
MPRVAVQGIEIEFDTFGDPANPPMLLLMGLGCQMTLWSPEFCQRLADAGFWVIRYDHRDIGLSTHLTDLGIPKIVRMLALGRIGVATSAPYTLEDMAGDALGLLDHLGVEKAHLVGVSMGGMIAQLLALDAPSRTASLCSWMSSTGARRHANPRARALRALLATPPRDRAGRIEHGVRVWRAIGSGGALFDLEHVRHAAAAGYDRSADTRGAARQLAAIVSAPPRDARLKQLEIPTLVMHGKRDPLIPVAAGKATAAAIPGARLVLFDELGHDVPPPLYERFAEAIVDNARRAAYRAPTRRRSA